MSLNSSRSYVLTGLVLIAGLIGFVMFVKRLPKETSLSFGGKVKGALQPDIVIEEFSDFQCPACQKATQVMDQIFKEYPGKIRLSFYHFPLKMHAWAMLAHRSAECADKYGKFWAYHDLLYARQKDWSVMKDPKEAFKQYAVELGLEGSVFNACLDQNLTQDIIAKDIQKGQALQVTSTPTFFVNGRRIVAGKLFEPEIRKLIQEELEK